MTMFARMFSLGFAFCLSVQPLAAQFWLPREAPTTTVEQLACRIDELEAHVDTYGSVVAKNPDVWGEERLTFHRQEFELEMAKNLDRFVGTINAQVRRSDQAFLASAISMESILAGGSRASSTARSLWGADVNTFINRTDANSAATASYAKVITDLEQESGNTSVSLEPTVVLDQMSRYLQHLHEIRRINEGDDTRGLPGYSMNLLRIPVSVLPGKKTRVGYGAEVTLSLSPQLGERQLPDVFREWVINDLVYQIGLPITDTLNSADTYLGGEEAGENPPGASQLEIYMALVKTLEESGFSWADSSWWRDPLKKTATNEYFWLKFAQNLNSENLLNPESSAQLRDLETLKAAEEAFESLRGLSPKRQFQRLSSPELLMRISPFFGGDSADHSRDQSKEGGEGKGSKGSREGKARTLASIISAGASKMIWENAEATNIRVGRAGSRNSQLPFPLSQFSTVYGQGILLNVMADAHFRTPRDHATQLRSTTDINAYLREEISAAYAMLSLPENRDLWNIVEDVNAFAPNPRGMGFRPQSLAAAIRNRDILAIEHARICFFLALKNRSTGMAWETEVVTPERSTSMTQISAHTMSQEGKPPQPDHIRRRNSYHHGCHNTTTGAFAWAIVVEAALLNEQLIRDMQSTASSKGCHCLPLVPTPYYLPDPPPQAAAAFNEYVKCRWPIHVFHVDPTIQDQNVGDSFSQQRELQLAMAIAFANGQIGIDQATQFARRIEMDMETVALNRTIVGFSHGQDTFGWRFGPRVQSPDIESNLTVKFRDLLIGGPSRDAMLKDHRIEPGARECVALVIAPSFLRQFIVDVHSDWYKLTNPRSTKPATADAVKMSRDIREMKCLANQCASDAHLYREGEVYRLLRRVDQLSAELPMQTMRVELPVANRLGGFRLMVPGAAFDRSPQLYAWHGLPGINPDGATTVFLTGENFVLHGLRVIAGNLQVNGQHSVGDCGEDSTCAPNVRLLNDSQLEVTIPKGAQTFVDRLPNGKLQEFVEVQIATYYGVSQKIKIPVLGKQTTKKETAKKETTPLVSFDWKSGLKNGKASVVKTRIRMQDFKFEQATKATKLVLQEKSGYPSGIFNNKRAAQLAFYIDFHSKDTNQKSKRASIGPFLLSVGGQFDIELLEDKINTKVLQLPRDFELSSISLNGFIRFSTTGANDNFPVYPLATTLEVDVDRMESPASAVTIP